MPTTSKGKNVVTVRTNHVAIGPPSTSIAGPPNAPAPAPFVYVAKGNEATNTANGKSLKIKSRVVVKGSTMKLELPANMPAEMTQNMKDVVSHAIRAWAIAFEGDADMKIDGSGVAFTTSGVRLNAMTKDSAVVQTQSPFVEGAGINFAGLTKAQAKGLAGPSKGLGDPVSPASGEVVEDKVDFRLPGRIPLVWRRIYAASFAEDRTPLGRGGWTHNHHQWIEVVEEGTRLADDDGRWIRLPALAVNERAFHRGKQLTVTRTGARAYDVYAHATRLRRVFSAPSGGEATPALLREVRDPWGNRLSYEYEGARLMRIVDTAGREIRIAADAKGRIARIHVMASGETHPLVAYTYSPGGELESAIDAAGAAESYEYDGRHRLARKVLAGGCVFRYAYHEVSGRCVKTSGEGGLHRVELIYDEAERTTVTHGTPMPRIYQWSARGELLREATPDGELSTGWVRDADGYVLEIKNAAGDARQNEYDERGNLTKTVDAGGNEIAFEYADDLPVLRTGSDGRVARAEHDAYGALVSATFYWGMGYQMTFDGCGRLAGIFGKDGQLAAFAYDKQHNLVRRTDARGAVTQYTYDALGRLTSETDALGRVWRRELDAAGRATKLVFPDGTIEELGYDARGNLIRVVDRLGHVFRMEYGGLHGLSRIQGPGGLAWEWARDAMERPLTFRNPKQETYELRYDRAGRVREERTFDGALTRICYSRAGKVARVDYPDDVFREYEHDALGNLVAVRSPHGGERYERDELGRLVAAILDDYDGEIAVTVERDTLGRVVAETQGARTIRFEYDDHGRRAARILPDGITTRYYYDIGGALVGLDHDGHKILIQRDVLGREVWRYAYDGGVDIRSEYDAEDRLIRRWAAVRGQTMVSQREWQRDAAGCPVVVRDGRWGSVTYAFDPLGRLVDASARTRRERFTYDAGGALSALPADEAGQGEPWAIGMGNVLLRTPEIELSYDGLRHRKRRKRRDRDEETKYLWDTRGRLREVVQPDGTRVLFRYDALSRRVRKLILPPPLDRAKGDISAAPPARVVEYLWDGHVLAAEIDSEHGVRVFVHEPFSFVPALHQEQGSVFVYVNDDLGTPRELIDEEGRVAWAADLTVWGQVAAVHRDPGADRPRPVETPLRSPGQYHDAETGLHSTTFRYFDPEVARWLSIDPKGLAGGLDLFGWNGNPVTTTDPLGLGMNYSWNYSPGVYGDFGGSGPWIGTGYQGHELLQNAWLEQQGLIGGRGAGGDAMGYFSLQNPSMALTPTRHAEVHAATQDINNAAKMQNMTAEQVINAQADAMKACGCPAAAVEERRKAALKHAPKFQC